MSYCNFRGTAALTDPADRIIYATAQEWGCPLVSADEGMQDIGTVSIIR